MKIIIALLKEKNRCLTRFKKISGDKYNQLKKEDYSFIEQFYYERQIILNAIEDIDFQLQHHQTKYSCPESKKVIADLLKKNRTLISHILKTDLLLHTYLNNSKPEIKKSQPA